MKHHTRFIMNRRTTTPANVRPMRESHAAADTAAFQWLYDGADVPSADHSALFEGLAEALRYCANRYVLSERRYDVSELTIVHYEASGGESAHPRTADVLGVVNIRRGQGGISTFAIKRNGDAELWCD